MKKEHRSVLFFIYILSCGAAMTLLLWPVVRRAPSLGCMSYVLLSKMEVHYCWLDVICACLRYLVPRLRKANSLTAPRSCTKADSSTKAGNKMKTLSNPAVIKFQYVPPLLHCPCFYSLLRNSKAN